MNRETGRIETGRVSIRETEDGWDLTFPTGDTEHHSTANEALQAVKNMGRVLCGGGVSTIFTVEWYPTSTLGRAVIESLQSR